jgi:hypothetical protein
MAIPPEEAGQADLRFPAIAVGTQIHLLILDGAPQPLHQDVVVTASTAGPADLDLLCIKSLNEA